jgi:hypothetical protein
MDTNADIVVDSADRLDNGVVVNFNDGKSAFFSATLLYSLMPQAEMMPSDDEYGRD